MSNPRPVLTAVKCGNDVAYYADGKLVYYGCDQRVNQASADLLGWDFHNLPPWEAGLEEPVLEVPSWPVPEEFDGEAKYGYGRVWKPPQYLAVFFKQYRRYRLRLLREEIVQTDRKRKSLYDRLVEIENYQGA